MSKRGRLSQVEKDQILAKAQDGAALKRLAKKLDRSLETLQKFVASNITTEVPPVVIQEETAPPVGSIERPQVLDAWGNPKAASREVGVVVATEGSSSRVDRQNKKMSGNTVENILKSRPDSTARIR